MSQHRAVVTVTAYPDGPFVLRGPFAIRDADGCEMDTGRVVALCRCGRSAVKPFCDGSHKRGALGPADEGG
jgi:CDGSH-type Zn-finger protein